MGNVTFIRGLKAQNVQYPITMGDFSSVTAGFGIKLNSVDTKVAAIYADDNGTAMTGNIRALLSRVLLTVDHAGDLSVRGVMGHLKLKNGVDLTQGVSGGVEGYLELAGTNNFGATSLAGAVQGVIELTTATTVTSGGHLAGLGAIWKSNANATGLCAGVLVRTHPNNTGKWGYGVYINAGGAAIGLQIGEFSSSAALGHHLTSTSRRAIMVYSDDNNAVLGADVEGVYSRMVFLAAQNAAYAGAALRGHFRGIASVTPSESKGYYGTLGQVEMSGTYSIGDGSNLTIMAGMGASIETGGTPTIAANGVICGLHVSGRTLPASPTGESLGIFFQAISQGFEHTFGFAGVGTTDGCGLTTGSDSTNVTHKIAVWINGVGTRYLHVFSD